MKIEKYFEDLEKRWPSNFVARDQVYKFTGDIISSGYMANLDCRGEGPPERLRMGRKVVYPVSSFVNWLMQRSKILS